MLGILKEDVRIGDWGVPDVGDVTDWAEDRCCIASIVVPRDSEGPCFRDGDPGVGFASASTGWLGKRAAFEGTVTYGGISFMILQNL